MGREDEQPKAPLAFYSVKWPQSIILPRRKAEAQVFIGRFSGSVPNKTVGRVVFPNPSAVCDNSDYFELMLGRLKDGRLLEPILVVPQRGFQALHSAAQMGVLSALECTEVRTAEDLSRLLLACGLADVSCEPAKEASAAT